MANEISIKITNLEQIKSAFGRAPALMSRGIGDAIKKTALTVQRKSMINTPVDTGRLRASTYSKFSPFTAVVGTNTDYDMFVHNGTRFQKAQPYLRDATNDSIFETRKFFTEAVDNVLSQIGRNT